MVLKEFWRLLYKNIADISFQNKTIDVVMKDCYFDKNITVCFGNLILSVLCLITLLLCIARIVAFYGYQRDGCLHYVIFSFASLEMLFLFIKWCALVRLYHLKFIASILKMCQLVTLCHLNWSLILNENKVQSLIRPLLGVFMSICTVIAVLAISLNFSSWIECLIPHWIIISMAELFCIQMYAATGYYVTTKINSLSYDDLNKRKQKIHLWSVICAYEISAIVTVVYYSVLQYYGDERIGCSGVFGNVQEIFSSIYTSVMITRYLLPIWVTISVFRHTRSYLTLGESFGQFLDENSQLIDSQRTNTNSATENNRIESSNDQRDEITPNQVKRKNSCPVLISSLFKSCNMKKLSASAPNYETNAFAESSPPIFHQPTFDTSKVLSVNQCSEEITYLGKEQC